MCISGLASPAYLESNSGKARSERMVGSEEGFHIYWISLSSPDLTSKLQGNMSDGPHDVSSSSTQTRSRFNPQIPPFHNVPPSFNDGISVHLIKHPGQNGERRLLCLYISYLPHPFRHQDLTIPL